MSELLSAVVLMCSRSTLDPCCASHNSLFCLTPLPDPNLCSWRAGKAFLHSKSRIWLTFLSASELPWLMHCTWDDTGTKGILPLYGHTRTSLWKNSSQAAADRGILFQHPELKGRWGGLSGIAFAVALQASLWPLSTTRVTKDPSANIWKLNFQPNRSPQLWKSNCSWEQLLCQAPALLQTELSWRFSCTVSDEKWPKTALVLLSCVCSASESCWKDVASRNTALFT